MMTRIEIEKDTAERLAEKAKVTGVSVDSLLKDLLDATELTSGDALTLEEFDRILEELAAGPDDLSPLPSDFSRADIYLDHD